MQLKEQTGRESPDYILACVGGGSNSMGAFYHYLAEPKVSLFGVEAAGCGLQSGHSAATLALGSKGVLHGSCTVLMQTKDGQVEEAHSASAGLDYPGVGPQHACLAASGRVKYVNVTDDEAFAAALLLTRIEGIIPALESAHALAYLDKLNAGADEVVVVNLSGRGDKDMAAYLDYQSKGGRQ